MEPRFRSLLSFVRDSVAPSTWNAYSQVWGAWWEVALHEDGCSSHQDRIVAILAYLSDLQRRGVSGVTVERNLAALSFLFHSLGWEDVVHDFLIRRMLRGWKRRSVPDNRRPVSLPLLHDLLDVLQSVCFSEYEVGLFRCVFLFAFYGAFRVGELVAPSLRTQATLLFQDVQVSPDLVRVWLSRSKTDTSGQGKEVFLRSSGARYCPVAGTLLYLNLRPQSQLSFFLHCDGVPLSRFQFVSVFRRGLDRLGVQSASYASHSFRIGAATVAHGLGFTDEQLRRVGRWESSRFRSYVRPHLL